MGIKERRVREKADRKQLILEVAQRLAAKEGWQAVTIRKIANEIEYSVPTIYEHFDSKEDLLHELMLVGYRLLLSQIKSVRLLAATPENEVKLIGEAYWEFAWAYPELYQVMHGFGGVAFGTPDTSPEIKEVFHDIRDSVANLPGAKDHSPEQLNDLVDLYWSTLHGLISLTMNGRIAGQRERAATLVSFAIEQYLLHLNPTK